MEDIVKGEIGKEGAYDVDIKDGKVTLNVKYAGSELEAGLTASVSVEKLIDKMKEKIPGKVDDYIFDLIKVALKAA